MQANEFLDIRETLLFKYSQKIRSEVDRHKWLESEKQHNDIGYERAFIDWLIFYREEWENNSTPENQKS